MVDFTFEVMGDAQILRSFSRLADEVKDWTPAWGMIRDDFKEIEQRQFDTQGHYGSGGWKVLSKKYERWKEKHYPGRGIMVRTGVLRESLIGGDQFVYRPEPLQMTIGTQVPYAVYHQKGGPVMPKRPLIELTKADKKRWSKLMGSYLIHLVNRV